MRSRAFFVAAAGAAVALAALRLPDANAPVLDSLSSDAAVRAAVASLPALIALAVLLFRRPPSALAIIASGLAGLLLLQPPGLGIVPGPFVPPSAGASLAVIGYGVVLVAGVALYRRPIEQER